MSTLVFDRGSRVINLKLLFLFLECFSVFELGLARVGLNDTVVLDFFEPKNDGKIVSFSCRFRRLPLTNVNTGAFGA